jgi:DNA helicase II / ATP-dependent DNA helicase PcrA
MPYSPKLQALLDTLNKRQVQGVNIGSGQAVVVGCAGGGKTRVVCARIARMVEDGLEPRFILAMTFTNQAAGEMNERLADLGIDVSSSLGCRVGTIHSVCRQIVKVESTLFDGLYLDTKNAMNFELKKLLDMYRRKGYIQRDRGDIEAIKRFIATCKCSGLSWVFENPFGTNTRAEDFIRNQAILWGKPTGVEPRRLLLMFIDLERIRAQKSVFSFDDMQLWAWMLLATDEEVRKRWRQRWSAIIMDEAQDSSFAQMDIARFLAGLSSCMPAVRELPFAPQIDDGHHSLMLVGDTAQCHPPGTLIDVGDRGPVPIEKLKDGAVIRSWNRHAQRMVGGRHIQVAKRPFCGTMHKVRVAGRSVDATPNHRLLCRWTERNPKLCVTYIMHRKGYGYRVGWCQLFTKSKTLHLPQRTRIEKADAVWILAVHKDRAAASLHESLMAAKYGLPTATFEPPHGAKLYTRAALKKLFRQLADSNAQRGRDCLIAAGRDPELPLWPWPNQPKKGYCRATYFEVYAANLLPEIMSVPLPEGRNTWTPVADVERRYYNGYVYSLDVEKDHSYAANGIVVLNSIYGWRDAHPEALLRYYRAGRTTKVHLNTNYRSNATLCAFCDKIVAGKSYNVNDPIISASGEKVPGCIKIVDYPSSEAEAVGTIEAVLATAKTEGYASTAILSRLNVGLQLVEIECIRNRVPYIKRSAGSFFDSTVCKIILAYLRVAAGKDPQRKWEQYIINRPFRYIGNDFVARALVAVGKSYMPLADMLVEMSDQLTQKQRSSVRQLQQLMDELIDMADSCRNIDGMRATGQKIDPEEDIRPGRLIETMVLKTKYLEVLRQQNGAVTMDESKIAAVSELVRMANMFGTAEDFLVYADRLAIAVQEAGRVGLRLEDKDEQQDALILSTIHKAKGLEWDHVHLIDVAAGRMPSAMSTDLEEERRLLFVASSRARDTLTISRPDGLGAAPGKITSPPGGPSSAYIRLARKNLQGL